MIFITSASRDRSSMQPRTAAPLLLFLSSLFALPAMAGLGDVYLPASEATVLAQLPAMTDPRVRAFDALQRRLKDHPEDPAAAVALARAYFEYGRGTGDARYLGRALAVIEPWVQQTSPPVDTLVMLAMIQQSRHLFDDARGTLNKILQREADHAQAWLILASIDQVQGQFDATRRDCAHLLGRVDTLTTAACIGALNIVTGRSREAYQLIDGLLQRQPAAAPGTLAWVEGLLAEAASNLGQYDTAEQHYRNALQLAPGDNFLLAEYADFLLDRRRPDQVIALLGDYRASDTVLLRLVIAETQLRLPQADADRQEMARRFADLAGRGDAALFAREQALFELAVLESPAAALSTAQRNWQIQRAPTDVRIYLAAALAAGQADAARPVLDFVAQSGLETPAVRALCARLDALSAQRRAVTAR